MSWASFPDIDRTTRVLQWTFRRRTEAVQWELGLSADALRYELRATPGEADAASVEVFNDAIAAFQRQAELERRLVAEGWSLESFQTVTR